MKVPKFSDFSKQEGYGQEFNRDQAIIQQPQGHEQQPQGHEQQPQGHEQQVQVVPQGDPFAMQKYQNVGVPDTPIQGTNSMVSELINDESAPEDVKKKFWFVFHKDNVLTFLDEKRKDNKLLNFDIAKIDMLNTTAYYDYTFEQELGYTILRNVFETKLDRSLGFKGSGQKNERIVLQSQFSENKQISENNQQNTKEGFFKRLLGRRN